MVADMGLDELTSYLKAQSVEGIIAYGMNEEDEFLRELIASGAFKIVLVDAPYHDRNTSSVWIDQKNAQYEIAKKTILGNESCTKVLYIAGDKVLCNRRTDCRDEEAGRGACAGADHRIRRFQ